MGEARVVLELDVRPPAPYRMPGPGRDRVMTRRAGVLARLLHYEGEPVVVRAWPVAGAVRLRAESSSRAAATHAIERMRFALCLDHDLGEFHQRFKRDRLLGPIISRRPWIRPARRAEPFEALAWAITEQLIESERAIAIERRLVRRFGRPSACGTLRDAPAAAVLAAAAAPELEACDLSPTRAIAMIRAAREVASGRVDLAADGAATIEAGWRRLATIRGVGSWTIEKLAFHGQGRDDQLPAGDLAYIKLVGDIEGLGRRATEDEVRAFFRRYAPFEALAGVYIVHARRAITRRGAGAGQIRSGTSARAKGRVPAAARS